VWRKLQKHRPNDFFDVCKMGHIAERIYKIDQVTRETMAARPAAERRVRGQMGM
jgi:hypothetical protein